ncbi:MAG: MCE family protein [Bacteroidetes bacterium]|nr:MCE family protein [Bacteroidota bacterium]
MSKEVRIGLMVALSVLVFFAGLYFLKGSSLFSNEYEYYAFYDNVQGLQPSAAVQIKGLQVGKVSDILLNREHFDAPIEVVISINKRTRLPRGTVAKLTAMDLLGTKGISLELGNAPDLVEDGGKLPSTVEGGIVDQLSAQASPLLQDLRKVVNNVDSVLSSVNAILNTRTRNELQMSVTALHQTMDNFNRISQQLNGKSVALGKAIDHAELFTRTLAHNSDNLDKTLGNLRKASDQLAAAPLKQTIEHIDSLASGLQLIADKMNSRQGSLGLLVNDTALYSNLSNTVAELGRLSADLKAHPSRYINLSIFGRKNRDR